MSLRSAIRVMLGKDPPPQSANDIARYWAGVKPEGHRPLFSLKVQNGSVNRKIAEELVEELKLLDPGGVITLPLGCWVEWGEAIPNYEGNRPYGLESYQ